MKHTPRKDPKLITDAIWFIRKHGRTPSPYAEEPIERELGRVHWAAIARKDAVYLTRARRAGYVPWTGRKRKTSQEAIEFFKKKGRRPVKGSPDRREHLLANAWSARVCPTHVLYDPEFVREVSALVGAAPTVQ